MTMNDTVLVVSCAPEVALNILINVERGAIISAIAECCVWCEAASDGTHYPAPFADILEDQPQNFFTACCQAHADTYREHYTALSAAVLRRNTEVK